MDFIQLFQFNQVSGRLDMPGFDLTFVNHLNAIIWLDSFKWNFKSKKYNTNSLNYHSR